MARVFSRVEVLVVVALKLCVVSHSAAFVFDKGESKILQYEIGHTSIVPAGEVVEEVFDSVAEIYLEFTFVLEIDSQDASSRPGRQGTLEQRNDCIAHANKVVA
jgi:hypothetical protein